MKSKTLDKTVPIPLYFQLKEIILNEIKNGNKKIGDSIPTEKELSEIFSISRTTVRQAISELVQEGRLYRVKSKGTFVSKPKINQSFVQELNSFNEQMQQLNKMPSTKLLEFEVIDPPPLVSDELGLEAGEKVVYIHRKRFADDEPIVMVKTYLPFSKCSFVLDFDLEQNSLYKVLNKNENTEVYKIRRFIEAVKVENYDMENLDVDSNNAIQQFVSIGYNSYDMPIEYSIARYRGDKNTFEVTVSINK